MKSWGILPSDNTVWWVILWIVMAAFFVGVAWFIMELIDMSSCQHEPHSPSGSVLVGCSYGKSARE